MPEKTVQKEPGKKPASSKKPKPQQEVVVQIPLSELHPFPDHPFQVREDASMQETAESVKEYIELDDIPVIGYTCWGGSFLASQFAIAERNSFSTSAAACFLEKRSTPSARLRNPFLHYP